jgi:hypothetical protein
MFRKAKTIHSNEIIKIELYYQNLKSNRKLCYEKNTKFIVKYRRLFYVTN